MLRFGAALSLPTRKFYCVSKVQLLRLDPPRLGTCVSSPVVPIFVISALQPGWCWLVASGARPSTDNEPR